MNDEWCVLMKIKKKFGLGNNNIRLQSNICQKGKTMFKPKEKKGLKQLWLLRCFVVFLGVPLCPTHVLFSSSPITKFRYLASVAPFLFPSKLTLPNFPSKFTSLMVYIVKLWFRLFRVPDHCLYSHA